MTTRHPLSGIGGGEAPNGRQDVHASAGVLAELGGAAAAAAQSSSVALRRGDLWGVSRDDDVALVAVEDGFVVVSTAAGSGSTRPVSRRIVVATAQRGMLLIPTGPSERIEALGPCRITIVSADSLRALLELPSVAEAIVDAFAEGLKERQAAIRICAHVRHSERVLEKLLQLARTYGRAVPGGVRIDFPLTHQLLADMVGSARETVSLALSDFAREDLVLRQIGGYVLRIGPEELFSTL